MQLRRPQSPRLPAACDLRCRSQGQCGRPLQRYGNTLLPAMRQNNATRDTAKQRTRNAAKHPQHAHVSRGPRLGPLLQRDCTAAAKDRTHKSQAHPAKLARRAPTAAGARVPTAGQAAPSHEPRTANTESKQHRIETTPNRNNTESKQHRIETTPNRNNPNRNNPNRNNPNRNNPNRNNPNRNNTDSKQPESNNLTTSRRRGACLGQ